MDAINNTAEQKGIDGDIVFINQQIGIEEEDLKEFLIWVSEHLDIFLKMIGRHTRSSTFDLTFDINGILYSLNIKGADVSKPYIRSDFKDHSLKLMGFETREDVGYVLESHHRVSKIPGFVTEIPLLVIRPEVIPFDGELIPNKLFASHVLIHKTSDFFYSGKIDPVMREEEELRIKSFIENTEAVVVLRLLPCAYRMEDLETLLEENKAEVETLLRNLCETHNINLSEDNLISEYLKTVLCTNLGQQLGLLHANSALHGCISPHNITLLGYLVDLDTFEFDYKPNQFKNKLAEEYTKTKKGLSHMLTEFVTEGLLSEADKMHCLNVFCDEYAKASA